MSHFDLVRSSADWKPLCARIAAKAGIPPESLVMPAPAAYPAAVCTVHVLGTNCCIPTFIYLDTLVRLQKLFSGSDAEPDGVPTQDDYNRHMAAVVQAVVSVLVDKGVATEAEIERRMVRFTAAVDQASADVNFKNMFRPPSTG